MITFYLPALIEEKKFVEIKHMLSIYPKLVDEAMPCHDGNMDLAHPLHRICDYVFSGKYIEFEAMQLAQIFIDHGSNINGINIPLGHDSPLTAACSLECDELAIFYMDQGADLNHKGFMGGTALHWSSWCGRFDVVNALIIRRASMEAKCNNFNQTPLLWAIHGYKANHEKQKECILLLALNGADILAKNGEGMTAEELIKQLN